MLGLLLCWIGRRKHPKNNKNKIWSQLIYYYVPPARKLVFSLQLTVAQCSILRYRGMKCKNWTTHAPIAMQRSTIFFLFFFYFVQCYHPTDKALYIWTAHAHGEKWILKSRYSNRRYSSIISRYWHAILKFFFSIYNFFPRSNIWYSNSIV